MTLAEKVKGMLLFSSALILYSFSSLCIKVAMNTYLMSAQEVLYYVSLVVLLCFYFSSSSNKVDILKIPPAQYKVLLLRCIGGFLSDIFLYMAFAYTNYSKAICIFFTNTLMLPFFARCILKEKILKWDVLGICIGFAGMILIVQPYKVVGNAPQSDENKAALLNEIIGDLLALAAAVAGALAIVYVRQVTQNLHNSVIGFYYTLSNLLLAPLWTFIVQRKAFPEYSWALFGILIGTGLLYFAMQSLMTYSMKFVTAAMSGVLIYVAIPISYVLDFLFFGK